ncbi:adenylate/guanylate cyclase domain-containing protein [Chitinophagaceae bacterium LB-8]|uniref:Adenylate/guanylate cyclase domain-containing protein n=1 Tax=Paraflavisolibacter caeni TaxID=2982496 RepID=A0A9X3BIS4_9BACT|nr:adenylate/guanylate cyclase domain-containing protein [Paraflavisolibacter caeni]MCU7551872.1 adenylate/guanylate cyclase domain-containing protein [Paraflavisolibacter caeni]
MIIPETKYAKSGDVNIAYQCIGKGTLDLICVMGWVSNVELLWEEPTVSSFLNRLATFTRLIIFDKRGTGLSDRVPQMPTLELRMDDVRAVMDAVGSPKAALLGISEGGSMCALFAATYPERTAALILCSTFAKRIWDVEYPWAPMPEERKKFFDAIIEGWGGVVDIDTIAPSMSNDERFKKWWATYLRRSASPGDALSLARMNTEIDIRNILPSIHVPTLVIHRKGDLDANIEEARYIAGKIPGSRLVECEGDDHIPWVGKTDPILDEIEVFLTGTLNQSDLERVLTTVLFTDVVGSTRKALELGDARWHHLLESHNVMIRKELARFRGREIKTTGDGFFATFDGPARGIRCACAIANAVRQLGIEVRLGLHTGECEIVGDDLGGIAVHTGARVMSHADAGEVLVSATVKDLVAGSGIQFENKGKHELKGVPGEWELYAVVQ